MVNLLGLHFSVHCIGWLLSVLLYMLFLLPSYAAHSKCIIHLHFLGVFWILGAWNTRMHMELLDRRNDVLLSDIYLCQYG